MPLAAAGARCRSGRSSGSASAAAAAAAESCSCLGSAPGGGAPSGLLGEEKTLIRRRGQRGSEVNGGRGRKKMQAPGVLTEIFIFSKQKIKKGIAAAAADCFFFLSFGAPPSLARCGGSFPEPLRSYLFSRCTAKEKRGSRRATADEPSSTTMKTTMSTFPSLRPRRSINCSRNRLRCRPRCGATRQSHAGTK